MGHLATSTAPRVRGCASTGQREGGGHGAGARGPDQVWRHDLPIPTRLSSVGGDGEGQQTRGTDRWGALQKHWNEGAAARLCPQ